MPQHGRRATGVAGSQAGTEQPTQETDMVRAVTTIISMAIAAFFNLKTKYQGEPAQVLIWTGPIL